MYTLNLVFWRSAGSGEELPEGWVGTGKDEMCMNEQGGFVCVCVCVLEQGARVCVETGNAL